MKSKIDKNEKVNDRMFPGRRPSTTVNNLSIFDITYFLYRWRTILAASALIGFLGGLGSSLFKPVIYETDFLFPFAPAGRLALQEVDAINNSLAAILVQKEYSTAFAEEFLSSLGEGVDQSPARKRAYDFLVTKFARMSKSAGSSNSGNDRNAAVVGLSTYLNWFVAKSLKNPKKSISQDFLFFFYAQDVNSWRIWLRSEERGIASQLPGSVARALNRLIAMANKNSAKVRGDQAQENMVQVLDTFKTAQDRFLGTVNENERARIGVLKELHQLEDEVDDLLRKQTRGMALIANSPGYQIAISDEELFDLVLIDRLVKKISWLRNSPPASNDNLVRIERRLDNLEIRRTSLRIKREFAQESFAAAKEAYRSSLQGIEAARRSDPFELVPTTYEEPDGGDPNSVTDLYKSTHLVWSVLGIIVGLILAFCGIALFQITHTFGASLDSMGNAQNSYERY